MSFDSHFVLLYDWRESYLFIGIICLHTSLCLPGNWSKLAYTVIYNSYTMGCPPVRGDNPRDLASGLSSVQVDKNGITILYHLHQCRPCTSSDISC